MDVSPLFWVLAAFAALTVGLSKGGLPAVAMLSVPVLSVYLPPAAAAGLLLPIYLLSDVYGVWRYRREFSLINIKILVPAGAIGTVVGYLTVTSIEPDTVKIAVAGVAFYHLGFQMIRRMRSDLPPRPASVPRGLIWGALSGFTSYIAHAGAPPYQAYMLPQKLPKMVFAGTTTLTFAAVNMMKVPAYIAAGQMTSASVSTAAMLAPFALFGAWAGYRLTRILPERLFFTLVEIALFLIACKLLYDVFGA